MIEVKLIEEKSRKLQTTRDNIAREYCQHLFLSRFYRQSGSEKILFKGGTALRILWQSPRFSDDLDFSGVRMPLSQLEDILQAALIEISREGLTTDIEESKKTTGGYLGKLFFRWNIFSITIKIEVSQRKSPLGSEQALVENEWVPPYMVVHLPGVEIVREKMAALITRGKARDFFDLYFILRSRRAASEFNKDLKLRKKILDKLHQTAGDPSYLRELKEFLPASHHALLKNFPSLVEKELKWASPDR